MSVTSYKHRRRRKLNYISTKNALAPNGARKGHKVAHALQVAVAGPFYGSLDYLLPENLRAIDLLTSREDQSLASGLRHQVRPGMRVVVPLGRREVIGIVVSIGGEVYCPVDKLRPITGLLEDYPLLTPELLSLGCWAASYYHYPVGEVLLSMLPQALRKVKALPDVEAVTEDFCGDLANVLASKPLVANDDQRRAISSLQDGNGFKVWLLWGVTGSGKTEVYLQWMQVLLSSGKQVLVLVPEISLTPQTIKRFSDRFKVPVYVLHSRLTSKRRAVAWLAAANSERCIVIGTRSALFTPLRNLGAIIIDEEHDISFKQHSKWRYHARDCAVMLAKTLQIPLLLGSATPALETMLNVEKQRYQLLNLPQRAGQAVPATWSLQDQVKKNQQHGLCDALISKVKQHLEKQGQVMFFLNRRGYAPVLRCHHCGWHANCQHCDSGMTLHQQPRYLLCHHCNGRSSVPAYCPSCQQSELSYLGVGTERLEEFLQKLFPEQQVLRIDRDSTRRVGELDKKLELAASGAAKILLGTQILAKGHHFPQLTLVVILDVDSSLYRVDFRSSEHMGQLITQVAGRSGRAASCGEVIIQTLHAQHPLLNLLMNQDYKQYSKYLLDERKLQLMPPYSYLVLIRGEAKSAELADSGLKIIKKILQQRGQELTVADVNSSGAKVAAKRDRFAPLYKQVTCSGPVAAPMQRCGDWFRSQLLLQSPSRSALQQLLFGVGAQLQQHPGLRKLRWSIDVDPQDMY